MRKLILPFAALALASAPASAEVVRSSAPVGEASQLAGESTLPWVLLAAILAFATFLVVQEEDDDNDPISV